MKNTKYKMIKEGDFFRIKALKSFSTIKKGDLGGLIQKQSNLSITGNAWVSYHATVFQNAKVSGNATISGKAIIAGKASV